MNLRRAETVTGLRIEVGTDNAGSFAQAYDGDGTLVKAMRSPKSVKVALGLLVEDLYKTECQTCVRGAGLEVRPMRAVPAPARAS